MQQELHLGGFPAHRQRSAAGRELTAGSVDGSHAFLKVGYIEEVWFPPDKSLGLPRVRMVGEADGVSLTLLGGMSVPPRSKGFSGGAQGVRWGQSCLQTSS